MEIKLFNSQSSKAQEINAGISEGSLLSPTHVLLYISDLSESIFQFFVNI